MDKDSRSGFIYVLYGSQDIISTYHRHKDSLLLANPYEFCVKKYTLPMTEDVHRLIKDALLYECYQEILPEEYERYHAYQCGALDLIFTKRLLEASYEGSK